MAVPNVLDREQYEAWLKTQPQEVSFAIMSRSALRILPLLQGISQHSRLRAGNSPYKFGSGTELVVLPSLRASALNWVAAKYPNQANGLKSYQIIARTAAGFGGSAVRSHANNVLSLVAASAAFAAITDYSTFHYSSDAFSRFDRTIGVDIYVDNPPIDMDVFAATQRHDFEFIYRGGTAQDLCTLPLWNIELPVRLLAKWQKLDGDLIRINEDWEVWTRWYDAVLYGRPTPGGEALDVFRVTLNSEEDWKKGPAHVNGLIKAKEAEIAGRWRMTLREVVSHSYGQNWVIENGLFKIVEKVDPRDGMLARTSVLIDQHSRLILSSGRLKVVSHGVEDKVGWINEGFEACIGNIHTTLVGNNWPADLSNLHNETLKLATFIEFDNDLRIAPDGNKTKLPPTVRRALSETLTRLIPFVLQFPSVVETDDKLGSILRRTDLKSPAIVFVDHAKQSRIVNLEDLERALELLRHSAVPSQAGLKSENRAYGNLRNLAIAVMSFYAGASLDSYKDNSVLVSRLESMLLAAEKPIVELLDQGQTGFGEAMKYLFEEIREEPKLPDDMANA